MCEKPSKSFNAGLNFGNISIFPLISDINDWIGMPLKVLKGELIIPIGSKQIFSGNLRSLKL